MGLELSYIPGQTPLSEEEKEGLLIKTISNRSELDEFEQLNIERAVEWSLKRKFKLEDIISEIFIKDLHKRMLGDVWKWAGTFRLTNKNLGIEWPQISVNLRNLINDCKYWIENKTYSEDELAIRFKHRLVSIHPFPNGNGRHSRLMADILISDGLNKTIFTWCNSPLVNADDTRNTYISALKEADKGNINPLLLFARS
ncbi:MAG: mobile mystery protein B [Ignavibacteriae bacterium]|nr:mobile mystery protein B [Ignavibacteriota bacterium]